MKLPALGVGLTYFSGIDTVLESHGDLVGVIEVEPQTLWYRTAEGFRIDRPTLDRIRSFPAAKLLHGIGFPVGGVRPPDPSQVPPLLQMTAELSPPWMSEHLSFNEVEGPDGRFKTGFLLPPRQTRAGVAAAVASIRAMAGAMPVPLAVETGVSYLRRRSDEMTDGEFVAAVVEAADCGILLDLHNLWANERNGRQPVEEFLDHIPLERVWEVHLAGGFEHRGYWLDSHSGPVQEPLLELVRRILPRLPHLRALIFELFPAYVARVGLDFFRPQLEELQRLWDLCGTRVTPVHVPARSYFGPEESDDPQPSPREWEDTLGALVVGRSPDKPLGAEMAADPGLLVIQELLGEFRASMVAAAFPLTSRYLFLTIGDEEFRKLLREFWRSAPPRPFASDEAAAFGRYLATVLLELPYLQNVLAFEQAVVATLVDGEYRKVPFEWDPLPLLRRLGEGVLPENIDRGDFVIEVTPDEQSGAEGSLPPMQQVLH
ncbi:MAG TPA: DUF692 family protein [Thermoanaerobaculia bacterium]|nr:DUF692 family protein [Thermoanaerobaculia bacterium]